MKETASVMQLVIAVCSLLAVIFFSVVIPFPDDMKMFMHQCSLTTIMVLCLIFGCSTWFYNSNYSKTRFHVRIMIVVVLWILLVLGAVTAILFDLQFTGKLLYGAFEADIFDTMDLILLYTGIIFSAVALIILLAVNIILTIGACRRAKK
ncbi:uncharacterized protein [Eurosta solidaginis]|uniref:uncharacterized protein n=1 Tax=Eurosta solidaginis TaxID=178769 RepID=UPI0035313B5D